MINKIIKLKLRKRKHLIALLFAYSSKMLKSELDESIKISCEIDFSGFSVEYLN